MESEKTRYFAAMINYRHAALLPQLQAQCAMRVIAVGEPRFTGEFLIRSRFAALPALRNALANIRGSELRSYPIRANNSFHI